MIIFCQHQVDIILSLIIFVFFVSRLGFGFPKETIKKDPTSSPTPTVISDTEISNEIDTFVDNSTTSGTKIPPSSSNITDYQYTGARVVSSSSETLVLKSQDDSEKITDWYKEKIAGKKMNATSFVSTTANDYVLNKLEGDNGEEKVSVEIKKENGTDEITITITLSP